MVEGASVVHDACCNQDFLDDEGSGMSEDMVAADKEDDYSIWVAEAQ